VDKKRWKDKEGEEEVPMDGSIWHQKGGKGRKLMKSKQESKKRESKEGKSERELGGKKVFAGAGKIKAIVSGKRS